MKNLADLRVDALFNQLAEATLLGCILGADASTASEIQIGRAHV